MTEGKPMGLILRFAMPLLLGNLLQQFYSLIDATIVGRYLGVSALAGVGASTSVMFLILGFCNGCSGGFGIPVAQRFGAKDYSNMRRHVYNGVMLTVIISVIFAVLTSLFCRQILVAMKTPEAIMDEAYHYLLFTFLSIPFTFMYNTLSGMIRALGDSKTPFLFLALASLLNVVFDLLFILVFGWGVSGVAVATGLAQAISAWLCFRYMHKRFDILRMEPCEKRLSWPHIKELLWMGVPMGLQFSITAIGSIMIQSSNNALGTACVAAFTAANRIKMFFICALENLGVAMATYCGQNMGAKKMDRVLSGMKDSFVLMALYCVFSFSVLWLFARPLIEMFVTADHVDILDKSEQFLHTSACFHVMLGTLCLLRYSIQGLGFSRLAIISGVFEMLARILVSLYVVPVWGFDAICIGDPSAWIAAVIFLIPAFAHVYRTLKHRFSVS